MLTLQQLITPISEDDALATILTILGQLGFQATSWQSGSIQVTILRVFARTWASFSIVIQQIAAGGFTTLAGSGEIPNTSPYLRLLAKYVYDIDFIPAQKTIGQILLTSSAAAPTHTWAAGDIIISDQPTGTDGANTYTVTGGGTLAPGSSVSAEFAADIAGASANIAAGTTLYLWSSLVGVTPTNPVVGSTSTWITTPGADDESDASLTARCIGKWSRLSPNNINGAYEAWAREALPALTRVSVESAAGDGNVTVIGATALGPIDSGQIDTIEDYINGEADGVGRRPLNDIFTAIAATTLSSPALSIDVYVRPDVFDTIIATVTAALEDYFGSIPIGGVKLIVGSTGIVPFSKIVSTIQDVDGVRKLLINISADISLTATQIYTPTISVTPHLVSPGT